MGTLCTMYFSRPRVQEMDVLSPTHPGVGGVPKPCILVTPAAEGVSSNGSVNFSSPEQEGTGTEYITTSL